MLKPPLRSLMPFGSAAIVAFVAALVVVGLGCWQIVRTRDAILADAEQNIRSLSRSLAQHAARTIESVDLVLTVAVERVEEQGDPDQLSAFLRRRADSLTQARNIVLIDAKGDRVSDIVAPHGPLTSADRDYFQWHRDHVERGLHIDSPIIGPTSGKAAIPFSRRVNAPDGTFAGLVVATLAPDYFETFYRTVKLSDQGTVALWMSNGRILARYPSLPDGKALPSSPIAEAKTAFAANAGLVRSRSPFDGIERLFAFEHVGSFPLVVSVAISLGDALSAWRQQAIVEGAALAAAAICLIVLGFGLERHARGVKAFEAASRENDRRYRLLAENASDLITLKPAFSGGRSYVSPSARTTVGWEPEELKSLPIERFIHPDDLDRVAAEFASLALDRPRVTSQHRVLHKNGHYVWLESVFRLTEEGNVIVAGRDVTARRDVEQSLAESETRFRQLADASSDMIQQLDLQGRRRYVSPAAKEIFGLDAAAMTGTHPVDFIHPDDAARVGAWIRELGAGERDQARSIHRIRHKAGHFVWVEVQFRLIREQAGGSPLEIVSSVRDVTQREELRQQLEGTNRLLLMAEEIAQVGHWRVALPGYALTWSDEVFRIHGRDRETFSPDVGTAVHLYHPEDQAEVDRCVTEAIAARRSFSFARRILRPGGEVRHVLSRGVCEIDAHGELTAIFGTIADVTDLRQAEDAAKQNETRYRLLADNTSDMITHMSLTGQRLFVSPGSRDLLGYEPEDLVGTSPQEMVHPEDASGLSTVFNDLANGTQERAVTVNRLRHRDGRWIWVEASLKALCGNDGVPTGVVGSVRNIMDRRRAEEAIRESEARYRLLADHSGDLIALKPSFEGARAYVSPSSRSVVGYDPDEFAALPASKLIHPDDRERVASEFASLSVDNPKITSLHRVRHKSGHWIWLDVDFRLTNPGQHAQSVIVRARDVSSRHAAEQALAASEARWSFALNSSGQGVWDVDLERDQTFCSPAWKALLGYADDELETSSSTWLDLMHPDDRQAAIQANLDHLDGRTNSFDAEFRMRHKDGRWIWIHDRGKVIGRDQDGRPLRMIGIHIDVTAQKRSERELRVAKERAEAGMAAKAEFVANMSHELRTPLTGILGVHDLLSNDPSLSDTQKRLVHVAGEAGRSLLSIVNDVLDFSKIDAGQMEIETVVFNIDAIITSCCDLAREGLKSKPVQILVQSAPDGLGHFMGDPTRVRQVLLNLLTNAVKFTPRGEVIVRACFKDDTGLLRIDVADSGIGISPDRIGSLFERFTQADTTMTRRYGGTGLGLAICKRLVDMMDGRIGVDAPAGGGSNFWFELPLTRHVGPIAVGSPRSVGSRASGCSLLLAEDNAINAGIIAAMLESCGHRVSIVPDGVAAEEAARVRPGFDMILMDLQMPVMDGLTATRSIRRFEMEAGVTRTPIVGLTANAMVEDVERCLAAGMDGHVAKPIKWASLFAIMDRLLGHSDGQRSNEMGAAHAARVLELSKLEELVGLIGRERLTNLLARFLDDLPARLSMAGSSGSQALSDEMHMLVSTSGQLGFAELSALCAEIDQQARNGAGLDRMCDLERAGARAIEAASRSGFANVA